MKSHLLDEARRLPLAERIELVEAIWDTVAEDASIETMPVPLEHRQELDRRLDDPAAVNEPTYSWEEVKARLERGR